MTASLCYALANEAPTQTAVISLGGRFALEGTMNHEFNVSVAKEVGILAATIFNNIGFWVDHNRATGRNLIDGRNWTYNSVRAFAEQFPYATDAQIAGALKKLRNAGLLDTGQYSEDRRDRSLWYTLSERGAAIFYGDAFESQDGCISLNNEMDSVNSANDYIHTDVNADAKPYIDQLREILTYLNERTGRNFRMGKRARSLMEARLNEGYSVNDFKAVIDNMVSKWKGTEWEQYLRPSTLFAPGHFDEYLNTPTINTKKEKSSYGFDPEKYNYFPDSHEEQANFRFDPDKYNIGYDEQGA